jgi:endogenous inhibitor of DNA gyrase (YacG/DUF329 family)
MISKIIYKCKTCKKDILDYQSNARLYCSKSCKPIWNKGLKNKYKLNLSEFERTRRKEQLINNPISNLLIGKTTSRKQKESVRNLMLNNNPMKNPETCNKVSIKSKERADRILHKHKIHKYFKDKIYREDYAVNDVRGTNTPKDITITGSSLLVDDNLVQKRYMLPGG